MNRSDDARAARAHFGASAPYAAVAGHQCQARVYAALAGARSCDDGLSYAIEPTRGDNADSCDRPRKSPA